MIEVRILKELYTLWAQIVSNSCTTLEGALVLRLTIEATVSRLEV